MPGLLYFIDGHQGTLTWPQIDEYGISHAFDRGPIPYHGEAQDGPGGVRGTIVCREQDVRPLLPVYMPAEQRWKRLNERVWVGLWKEAPPGPDDLRRRELLPGYELRFEDGHNWRVPVVYVPDDAGQLSSILPCYVDTDEFGRPVRGEPIDAYAWLHDVVRPFFDAWLAAWSAAVDGAIARKQAGQGGEDPFANVSYVVSHDTMALDAAKVLGANYRVSLPEVALLRLWRDDRSTAAVLRAAADIDECEAILFAQKKRAAFGHSSAAAG